MSGARELLELRTEVANANRTLPQAGLVTMHSGNVSGCDRQADVMVIKPSGMDYDLLTPENLVAVRISSGEVLTRNLKPSVDLPHHLYLYRNDPTLGAVVHTHSNYATAFAAVGRSIPLVLTAIADEFGEEIPCAPYLDNEEDHIGQGILKHRNRSPAILLQNHGVFAWGETVRAALKAAVMVEDVAKTVWLSYALGTPKEISKDEAAKWFGRYHSTYGQK